MPLALDHAVRQAIVEKLQEAPAPARKGIGRLPYAAAISGNVADMATTIAALRGGRGREGNPLMARMGLPAMTAVKGAGTVLEALAMHQLAKAHPTAAKALGYGIGAVMGGLAVHNARVGRT